MLVGVVCKLHHMHLEDVMQARALHAVCEDDRLVHIEVQQERFSGRSPCHPCQYTFLCAHAPSHGQDDDAQALCSCLLVQCAMGL